MAMCMGRVGTTTEAAGADGAITTAPAVGRNLTERMPGSPPPRYIRHVKPILRCSFLAFMALNLTWGHDWVHVPGLLKHFEEHKAEKSGLGFLDFLAMHYADADHRDSDGSHEDLPFSHGHQDHIGVDHVYWSPVLPGRQFHLPAMEANAFALADDPLDGYLAHALRPPRRA